MSKVSCRLFVAACMVAGMSAPASAETLEEVLASTYGSNPNLLARRAKLRATDEGVPQALSNWRPTVSLTGSAGRGTYDYNTISHYTTVRSPRTEALTVTQPLFRGGRTLAATAQAENNVLAERAQLAATEQTVLLAAATAYLNVVRDEAVLKLSINNEQVLQRQLDATKARFDVGDATRTDISQSEARLAKATADRVAAEGNLQSSRANYVNSVGRPPEALSTPAAPPPVPASLDEVTAAALASNPNVVSADYTHAAAKDNTDLIWGELMPTVSLSADMSRGLQNSTGDSSYSYKEVLLNVTVPLYESGSVYSRVRASKHTAGQRRIEADQARRDAVETGAKAWEGLQAARAQAVSYQSQIKAAELALAGVRQESAVGSRTILDVLNAEQELFDARVNLVKAQRDVLVSSYQVKSAQGQMTASGLNLPVDVYDPTKHYDDIRGQWIGNGIDKEKGYE